MCVIINNRLFSTVYASPCIKTFIPWKELLAIPWWVCVIFHYGMQNLSFHKELVERSLWHQTRALFRSPVLDLPEEGSHTFLYHVAPPWRCTWSSPVPLPSRQILQKTNLDTKISYRLLSMILSIYHIIYLSMILSIYLWYYLSIYDIIYMSMILSIYLLYHLYVYDIIYLSIILSIYLSYYISIYYIIYLSI